MGGKDIDLTMEQWEMVYAQQDAEEEDTARTAAMTAPDAPESRSRTRTNDGTTEQES